MDVASDEGKAAPMPLKDTSIMITFTFKGSVHPNHTTSILQLSHSGTSSCGQLQFYVLSFLNTQLLLTLPQYNGGERDVALKQWRIVNSSRGSFTKTMSQIFWKMTVDGFHNVEPAIIVRIQIFWHWPPIIQVMSAVKEQCEDVFW